MLVTLPFCTASQQNLVPTCRKLIGSIYPETKFHWPPEVSVQNDRIPIKYLNAKFDPIILQKQVPFTNLVSYQHTLYM